MLSKWNLIPIFRAMSKAQDAGYVSLVLPGTGRAVGRRCLPKRVKEPDKCGQVGGVIFTLEAKGVMTIDIRFLNAQGQVLGCWGWWFRFQGGLLGGHQQASCLIPVPEAKGVEYLLTEYRVRNVLTPGAL